MKTQQKKKLAVARKATRSPAAIRQVAWPLLALLMVLNGVFLSPARTAESNPALTPQAAEAAAGKLRQVQESARTGRSFGSVRISEAEANSYLLFQMSPLLPAGLSDTRLAFRPNRPRGTAEVDFDKLRAAASAPPSPVFDYLLRGVHTLGVEGTLYGSQGVGEFRLESVSLDGVPVPQFLVDFLIDRYVKSRYPNAAINRSFLLPYSIESLSVESGSVLVVGQASERL